MAKKKRAKAKKLNSFIKERNRVVLVVLLFIFMFSLAGNAVLVRLLQTHHLYDKKNSEAMFSFQIHPNQACNWQDFDKLEGKFNLNVQKVRPHSIYGGIYKELPDIPVAQHICALSTNADTESETTLATVKYFLDNDDAKRYAQKELEPTKWWSPGTGDNDLWRIMSYITIADGGKGKTEKADAYAVKDDMVIEVTLPCTKVADPGACDNAVRSYIDIMIKNLNETYGGENQNPFRTIREAKY